MVFEVPPSKEKSYHPHVVNDWQDFVHVVEELAPRGAGGEGMLFRGQPNAGWPLIPRIARNRPPTLSTDSLLEIERRLTRAFLHRAHTYLPPALASIGSDGVRVWTIMQHYGAPTRLLDWTASPYVAAYFAVRDLLAVGDPPGAIWYFNIRYMQEGAQHQWGDNYLRLEHFWGHPGADALARKGAIPMTLEKAMDRMSSQLAQFTIAGDPSADHWASITEAQAASDRPNDCGCIAINSELKAEFLRQLYGANVQAAALFPGLDGIGQLIHDSLCLSTHAPEFGWGTAP